VILTGLNTDTPDPFILRAQGGYYLYSGEAYRSGSFYPVMVAFSLNSRHFPPPVPAMLTAPKWTTDALTWSPDVVKIGQRYQMYFASMSKPAFGSEDCIGTASAANPAGPFVPEPKPLNCDADHFGAIDPRVFTGADGARWLLWKSDENANPSPHRLPSEIVSERLSQNGKGLVGTPRYLLRADQPWQAGVVEAPELVHTRGHYWLFYSGGLYTSAGYGVGIASCQGPSGPCTDLSVQPWLSSNSQGQGPGEASLLADTHGRWWLVYDINDGEQRRGDTRPAAIAPISFAGSCPMLTS
jgi:beta-xylosidase